MGAVLEREPELNQRLVSIIQTRGGTVAINLDPPQALPPSPPGSIDVEMDEGNKIAMFTMKLNEWCTQRAMNMSYDDTQLSVDPPLWQVQVRVEGATFTGRAKKKAKARHIASKQACEALEIHV